MKYVLLSLLLGAAAALMAEPPAPGATPPPQGAMQPEPGGPGGPGGRETPEMIAQLKKDAETLEAAIKANPRDVELNIRLGFTYARLKKADDAQRAFENAVALNPKKDIAHYMLGLIYEKKGLKDKAVQAWKNCLDSTVDPRLRDTAIKHLHHLEGR